MVSYIEMDMTVVSGLTLVFDMTQIQRSSPGVDLLLKGTPIERREVVACFASAR